MDLTKPCRLCGNSDPAEWWTDGTIRYCKPCDRRRGAKYYRTHRTAIVAKRKAARDEARAAVAIVRRLRASLNTTTNPIP